MTIDGVVWKLDIFDFWKRFLRSPQQKLQQWMGLGDSESHDKILTMIGRT